MRWFVVPQGRDAPRMIPISIIVAIAWAITSELLSLVRADIVVWRSDVIRVLIGEREAILGWSRIGVKRAVKNVSGDGAVAMTPSLTLRGCEFFVALSLRDREADHRKTFEPPERRRIKRRSAFLSRSDKATYEKITASSG